MSERQAQDTVEEIFSMYERFGSADYIGEPVSQLEHMSQSADFAMRDGADDEVVLAAFFHDLGHICVIQDSENKMAGFGIMSHEKIGADFLRSKGFPETVAKLVENHVQAKRYLTFRYPEYFNRLSEASKKTLVFQGGRMTSSEASDFEKDPLFKISLKLRKWDELAKERNIPITDLSNIKLKALVMLKPA